MRELLAEFLRAGQARGEVYSGLDVETVASVLLSLIDGCKAAVGARSEARPEEGRQDV
jgi:hypothetical protein